jgi:hypothetical protein
VKEMKKLMYKHAKDTREKYRHLEVEVDPMYKLNVKNRVYPKCCFDKSWDYIAGAFSPKNARLVHGTCLALGDIRIQHGWIELEENIVFDGVYQRFYDKEKYYLARGMIKDFEYTKQEVMNLSSEYMHKGPWQYRTEGGKCFDF